MTTTQRIAAALALLASMSAWAGPQATMSEADRTYYSGEYGLSLALYKQLAAAGNAEAAERAGFMLLQGGNLFGPQVHRDVDRAMKFLEQAADAGRPAAGFLLNMVLTSD